MKWLFSWFRRPKPEPTIEIPNPWAYCGSCRVVYVRRSGVR